MSRLQCCDDWLWSVENGNAKQTELGSKCVADKYLPVVMNKTFIITSELKAGEGMWEKAVVCVCVSSGIF